MVRRLFLLLSLSFGLVFLAACDTAEERAQEHYEKGLSLLEEGDVDRALVEFRNVFKLNGSHRDARMTYAQVEEQRGNFPAAYGQYLRLVEQYPEDLEGRRALARLASDQNNWEEVSRHVAVAETLAPEDPMVQAIRAGLDYRNALRDKDPVAAGLAVKVSETLLQDNPDISAARRVVIDDLLYRQDWPAALDAIDASLEHEPDTRVLYMQRLAVLEKLGRDDAIEDQLKDMVEKFPEENLHRSLVGWYVGRSRLADAETFLRERIVSSADDAEAKTDAQLELIGFLARYVGRQEALAEVNQVLEQNPENPALFRSMRAELDFDSGAREAAIIEMEDILKDAEPSVQTNRIRISLAKMLIRTGNSVGARAQVEEVLAADSSQVDALKMKAAWLIEDDQTGDALVELRQALDQKPRDAEIMTLMAQAHQRAGNNDLMGEMLSLAVEASDGAPEESLRYARFLLQDDKLLSAEDVLQTALRLQNTNPILLGALGNVYIRMEDWPRAQHVIDTLDRIGTDQTAALVNQLTAQKLAGQNREDELQSFLTTLADDDAGGGGMQAAAAIIRLRLAQGDATGALEYTEGLLEQNPDNPSLRFIRAGILAANGNVDEAVVVLRELSGEYPQNDRIWLTLYNMHRSRGDVEQATAVLKEGRTALPNSGTLKWIEAGEAERNGDIDRAIAIYEELYSANSNSMVVANNLASLISSYHEDDESLQRAYSIARRLRGTKVAPFQDTYGWITFRLGNHEEALEYLEPAAKGLPDDLIVQYHLAEAYNALGFTEDALKQYGVLADLAEKTGKRPSFMDDVEAKIKELGAAPDQAGAAEN